MSLDKQITKILLSNVEFGVKNKTVWVSKIVPQLKRLIKEVANGVINEKGILSPYYPSLERPQIGESWQSLRRQYETKPPL